MNKACFKNNAHGINVVVHAGELTRKNSGLINAVIDWSIHIIVALHPGIHVVITVIIIASDSVDVAIPHCNQKC